MEEYYMTKLLQQNNQYNNRKNNIEKRRKVNKVQESKQILQVQFFQYHQMQKKLNYHLFFRCMREKRKKKIKD